MNHLVQHLQTRPGKPGSFVNSHGVSRATCFEVSENAPCCAPPFVGKVSNTSQQNFLTSHSKKEMLFLIKQKLFTVWEPLLEIMSFHFLVFKMSLQHQDIHSRSSGTFWVTLFDNINNNTSSFMHTHTHTQSKRIEVVIYAMAWTNGKALPKVKKSQL